MRGQEAAGRGRAHCQGVSEVPRGTARSPASMGEIQPNSTYSAVSWHIRSSQELGFAVPGAAHTNCESCEVRKVALLPLQRAPQISHFQVLCLFINTVKSLFKIKKQMESFQCRGLKHCSTTNRPLGKATKSKINVHFKTINRLYSHCFSFGNAGPNSVLD